MMSFETYLICCIVLVVFFQLADLTHCWWCHRRSERRFREAMAPRRSPFETAAGEVA